MDYIFHACPVFELFYECKREGILYRAHQNHQSIGPWYEWVMVKFIFKDGNDSNSKMEQNTQQPLYFDNDEYLSKVFCFFKADRKPEIHAIVQSMNQGTMDMIPFFFSSGEKDKSNISDSL